MGSEFLTPEEAAKLLRVSRRTIYRCIYDGIIPAIRLGQLLRIKASDLEPDAKHFLSTSRRNTCNS